MLVLCKHSVPGSWKCGLLPHVQAVVLGCLLPKTREFFCSVYTARVVFPSAISAIVFAVPLPTVLDSYSIGEISKNDLHVASYLPMETAIPLLPTTMLLSQDFTNIFCENWVRSLEKSLQEGANFPYIYRPQKLYGLTSSLPASINCLTELLSWTLISVCGCICPRSTNAHIPLSLKVFFFSCCSG